MFDVEQLLRKRGIVFPRKLDELKYLRIEYTGAFVRIDKKFLKFISRFSKLEVLKLETMSWGKRMKWNLLENLKNLKEISIKCSWNELDDDWDDFVFFRAFKSFKSEILEILFKKTY